MTLQRDLQDAMHQAERTGQRVWVKLDEQFSVGIAANPERALITSDSATPTEASALIIADAFCWEDAQFSPFARSGQPPGLLVKPALDIYAEDPPEPPQDANSPPPERRPPTPAEPWRPGHPTTIPLESRNLKKNTLYHAEVNGILCTFLLNNDQELLWRELHGPQHGKTWQSFNDYQKGQTQ